MHWVLSQQLVHNKQWQQAMIWKFCLGNIYFACPKFYFGECKAKGTANSQGEESLTLFMLAGKFLPSDFNLYSFSEWLSKAMFWPDCLALLV
jgi:hypothetical protein